MGRVRAVSKGAQVADSKPARSPLASAFSPRRSLGWQWIFAPACAVLILATSWWALQRPRIKPESGGPHALEGVSVAFDWGAGLPGLPDAAVNPLAGELDRFNQDLDNTAQFLLANLP